MLINLTNHPSASWNKDQLEKTYEQYGEVIDLPFPEIDPEATESEVAILADEYVFKCRRILNNTNGSNAVHVMGEITFCFSIINKLKQHHINCIASTTRRKVIQNNNIRTSEFIFCKFRKFEI